MVIRWHGTIDWATTTDDDACSGLDNNNTNTAAYTMGRQSFITIRSLYSDESPSDEPLIEQGNLEYQHNRLVYLPNR